MAVNLELKDAILPYVAMSSQPVVPIKSTQAPRRQGQEDDVMLPHFEALEEDEEEGGVALINIFNPFASWTKS